ncbi:MAG TPA: ATP-binding protein [Myxococcaceae bacterium]|nr:ATP-binding protein [Myxococcaceae bacterium]
MSPLLSSSLTQDLGPVLDALNDGVIITELSGSMVFVNDSAARLMGFERAEALRGLTAAELMTRYELRDASGQPLRLEQLPSGAAARGEPSQPMELRCRVHETGAEHWVVLSAYPMRDSGGRVTHVVSIFRDVTAERASTRSLRFLSDAGKVLAGSLDYATTLTVLARLAVPELADICSVEVVDDDGAILREVVSLDPRLEQLARRSWGRYPKRTLSPEHAQMLRPEEPHHNPRITDELLRRSSVDEEHYQLQRELGPKAVLTVPLKARGRSLGTLYLMQVTPGRGFSQVDFDLAVELGHRAGVAVENARLYREAREALTRMEEAQEQIRGSEEQLRLALAAGQMGYFDWDMTTGRMVLSPRMEAIFGVDTATWEGTVDALRHRIHPDDVRELEARQRRQLEEGFEGESWEYRVVRPDGKVRWVSSTGTFMRNAAGIPVRSLGVAMDVTDRHEAQQKADRLLQDLIRSNTELEQFAYVASHDLQEPLRMVSSYTQLLARRYRGKLDEDADEFIRYTVEGVGRMKRLITDLLTYSRLGSQAKPHVPVDCEEVARRAITNLTAAIEESRAEVTTDVLPRVMGDEVQLEQLLQNLIGNAIKFRGEAPPRVHVSVERKDADWVFCVRDNGIGIEPRYFERIFVIFQRLHGAREYSGTGLGLAICKKIVERHGGRIWLESAPGEGSRFLFTLPVSAAASAPTRLSA